jgi:O-antigen/teichoic acid export membrane protein
MDFGFANATMRETTIQLARADDAGVNRTINTALRIYTSLGAIVFVSTIALVVLAPLALGSVENLTTIRIVLFIIGIDLTLTFPTKALAGIVQARLRYDLLLVLDMVTFLLNITGTVWALKHGYGVLALAVITLLTGLLNNVLYVGLAKYLFRGLKLDVRRFDKDSGRRLASYSLWSFLIQLANQLRFRIDALTTGALFGGEAITRYTIGSRLVEYAQSPMTMASNTAMPALASMHASEEREKFSEAVLFLLRCNLLLAIYSAGLVMLLGRPFIVRWMGPEHADSHEIASLLAVGFMTELFLLPLTNALLASAKHRMLAIANCVEAVANVGLSIWLGYLMGLRGVALGTVLPLMFVQLAWVMPYACRVLEIRLSALAGLIAPGVIALVIFAALASGLESTAVSNGYVGVILAATVASIGYWSLTLLFCMRFTDRRRLWDALPLPARRRAS